MHSSIHRPPHWSYCCRGYSSIFSSIWSKHLSMQWPSEWRAIESTSYFDDSAWHKQAMPSAKYPIWAEWHGGVNTSMAQQSYCTHDQLNCSSCHRHLCQCRRAHLARRDERRRICDELAWVAVDVWAVGLHCWNVLVVLTLGRAESRFRATQGRGVGVGCSNYLLIY